LSGDVATAATASAGRFGPAGRRTAGDHCAPLPRHHAGARVFLSAAKTSTRPGPEATAETPTAGIEAGPASSGAGGPHPFEVSDHRQTVLPGPVANTSRRLSAQEHALGGPARPPGSVKVFIRHHRFRTERAAVDSTVEGH
jgi:hypothetical protein